MARSPRAIVILALLAAVVITIVAAATQPSPRAAPAVSTMAYPSSAATDPLAADDAGLGVDPYSATGTSLGVDPYAASTATVAPYASAATTATGDIVGGAVTAGGGSTGSDSAGSGPTGTGGAGATGDLGPAAAEPPPADREITADVFIWDTTMPGLGALRAIQKAAPKYRVGRVVIASSSPRVSAMPAQGLSVEDLYLYNGSDLTSGVWREFRRSVLADYGAVGIRALTPQGRMVTEPRVARETLRYFVDRGSGSPRYDLRVCPFDRRRVRRRRALGALADGVG